MIVHKKIFYKSVYLFIICLLFFNLLMTRVFAESFTDVSDKYEDAVNFLVEQGIDGKGDGKFGTDEYITRVDAAVFVVKALELNVDEAPMSGFTDVPLRAQKAVNALKEAKITSGKTKTTFGANDQITRGELAIWLVKAFELVVEGKGEEILFSDVAPRYKSAVQTLVHYQITTGISTTHFGTTSEAKRGDFALFLYRANAVKTEAVPLKIDRVDTINGNQIEVYFNQSIDLQKANAIEAVGNRIVVYDRSQQATTAGFVSEIISFSNDKKSAMVILKARNDREQALVEGKYYTVALVSHYGDHLGFAEVEAMSATKILLEGLGLPSIEIDESQNYMIMQYDRKMSESVRNPQNFEVYDFGVKLNDVLEEGEWEDSTTKSSVKFKIKPNVLRANKVYKVKFSTTIESALGEKMSQDASLGEFGTPTIEEAKPKVEMIRVTSPNEVTVTFDKILADIPSLNLHLFSIKTKDGISIDLQEVKFQNEHLILTTKEEDAFNEHLSYSVSLRFGVVVNETFPNAVNDEVIEMDAVVTSNEAPTTLKAEFIRPLKDKRKANLHLTFDHAIMIENVEVGDIRIERFGETYFIAEGMAIELDRQDLTGRTLVIKDVSNAFMKDILDDTTKFIPNKKETYQVIVKKGVAKSIAPVPEKEKQSNQADIKSTVTGIDIQAPKIEKVTLNSAEKITIQFDKELVASELMASDIRVAGFVKATGARYEPAILTGKSSLKFTIKDNELTITPASNWVVFQTGVLNKGEELFRIAADTIKDIEGLENVGEPYIVKVDESFVYDHANPIMIGATVVDSSMGKVEITYSEAIYGKVNLQEKIARQFHISGAERNSLGTTMTIAETAQEANHIIEVYFDEKTFINKDYSSAKLLYTHNLNYAIRDTNQNEQKSDVLTGIFMPLTYSLKK